MAVKPLLLDETGMEIANAIKNMGSLTDEQAERFLNNWLDEHPEATTTVLDGSITESKFHEALKEKIYYQRFSELEGETDTEKMNNFLSSNSICGIYLDRNIIVNDVNFASTNRFIDGRGHTIYVNGTIQPFAKYCQMNFVTNCVFDGSGGGNFVLQNGTGLLYEMYFTNCKFINFTKDIFTGGEMQSFRFTHCYFDFNAGWVINVSRADALTIANCNCEGGTNFVKLDKSLGVTVRDTVVEGLSGRAFEFLYYSNVKLDTLYMEANKENIVVAVANSKQMILDNIMCYCTGNGDTKEMLKITNLEGPMYGCLIVDNCTANYGYLVNVDGIHANHGLRIDIRTNNNADLGLININMARPGIVAGSTVKHFAFTATGIGTKLTFTTEDTEIYANCLVGGLVVKVMDELGRNKNYKTFELTGANSFVLDGDGETNLTYKINLLYV